MRAGRPSRQLAGFAEQVLRDPGLTRPGFAGTPQGSGGDGVGSARQHRRVRGRECQASPDNVSGIRGDICRASPGSSSGSRSRRCRVRRAVPQGAGRPFETLPGFAGQLLREPVATLPGFTGQLLRDPGVKCRAPRQHLLVLFSAPRQALRSPRRRAPVQPALSRGRTEAASPHPWRARGRPRRRGRG